MKTFMAKEPQARDWFVVDATNKTLGRMATEIASRLKGKHKAEYTPHVDCGDCIVVVNTAQVRVTGKKTSDKVYNWHTGYPGGIKEINFEKLQVRDPNRIVMQAVKGMLPRGPLGRQMLKKLKLFSGAEHTHQAQQPQPLEI